MAIDWPTVATTVLGSGVTAAVVTQGIAAFRDHTQRRARGRMVALSAAVALERFGCTCADLVADAANHHYSEGTMGAAHRELPVLQLSGAGADLNLLPIHVASLILEFEAAIGRADVDLQDTAPHSHFEQATPIFLRLGEEGFEIAMMVREKMCLPCSRSRDLDMRVEYLSEQREAFEREKVKVIDDLQIGAGANG